MHLNNQIGENNKEEIDMIESKNIKTIDLKEESFKKMRLHLKKLVQIHQSKNGNQDISSYLKKKEFQKDWKTFCKEHNLQYEAGMCSRENVAAAISIASKQYKEEISKEAYCFVEGIKQSIARKIQGDENKHFTSDVAIVSSPEKNIDPELRFEIVKQFFLDNVIDRKTLDTQKINLFISLLKELPKERHEYIDIMIVDWLGKDILNILSNTALFDYLLETKYGNGACIVLKKHVEIQQVFQKSPMILNAGIQKEAIHTLLDWGKQSSQKNITEMLSCLHTHGFATFIKNGYGEKILPILEKIDDINTIQKEDKKVIYMSAIKSIVSRNEKNTLAGTLKILSNCKHISQRDEFPVILSEMIKNGREGDVIDVLQKRNIIKIEENMKAIFANLFKSENQETQEKLKKWIESLPNKYAIFSGKLLLIYLKERSDKKGNSISKGYDNILSKIIPNIKSTK